MEKNKIIDALRRCTSHGEGCQGCPYYVYSASCIEVLHQDAADAMVNQPEDAD